MSVLLVGNGRLFLDIAARLVEHGELEVSHIVTYPDFYAKYEVLKTLQLLNWPNFITPEGILALNKENKKCLSETLLQQFIKAEHDFLVLSDRWSYNLTVLERQRLYSELLLFWHTFLQQSGITEIIFRHVPHSGWDNVVYYVAKHLGIRTLMREDTLINNAIFYRTDYLAVDKVPETFMAGASMPQISQVLSPELRNAVSGESDLLKSMQADNRAALRKSEVFNALVERFPRLLLGLFRSVAELFGGAGKQRRVVALNPYTHAVAVEWARCKLKWRSISLNKHYNKVVRKVDLRRKYVYFALHYQPERTSFPMAEWFQDQVLAIRILSRSLPEGWRIYVKEHPMQFSSDFGLMSAVYRDKAFYQQLLSFGNVDLVAIDVPSQELVKHAQFVSTLTGSMGWEGLVAGKACIVFGNPWYSACNSCYVVRSLADCEKAVEQIRACSAEEVKRDLLRFLAYYQDRFVASSLYHQMAARTEEEYNPQVEREVEAIARWVQDGSLSFATRISTA